jgi:hypothetical protein
VVSHDDIGRMAALCLSSREWSEALASSQRPRMAAETRKGHDIPKPGGGRRS